MCMCACALCLQILLYILVVEVLCIQYVDFIKRGVLAHNYWYVLHTHLAVRIGFSRLFQLCVFCTVMARG